MPKNLRAVFGSRRRGFPPSRNTGVEQFVGGRLVIPDGDRRQSAESRNIVSEPNSAGMVNDDVMGVFILNDDVIDHLYRFLAKAPAHDIFQRFLRSKQSFDARA